MSVLILIESYNYYTQIKRAWSPAMKAQRLECSCAGCQQEGEIEKEVQYCGPFVREKKKEGNDNACQKNESPYSVIENSCSSNPSPTSSASCYRGP